MWLEWVPLFTLLSVETLDFHSNGGLKDSTSVSERLSLASTSLSFHIHARRNPTSFGHTPPSPISTVNEYQEGLQAWLPLAFAAWRSLSPILRDSWYQQSCRNNADGSPGGLQC